MSCIPFCRATQALSIGIQFNFYSEKILRKKSTNMNMNLYWMSLRGQYSSLAISPWERLNIMSYIWFDAELNGLQNGL